MKSRLLTTVGLAIGLTLLVLALLALLGRLPEAVHAAPTAPITRYVSTSDPTCGGNIPCYTVIQDAVDAAGDGDVILVATGTYTTLNAYGGHGQVLYISKTVTIRGGYDSAFAVWDPEEFPAILDAKMCGRVVYIDGDVAPTLEGLWVTRGATTASGGGIASNHASPVISGCHIYDNAAGYGGGAWIFDSDGAVLVNNDLYNNTADWSGGGVNLSWNNNTLITGNTIHNNEADSGGGVGVHDSTNVVVTDNELYDNAASSSGGGMRLSSGSRVAVTGNRIHENEAHFGGGIRTDEVNTATLTGNFVYSNTANSGGGAYVMGRLGGLTSAPAYNFRFPVLDGNTFISNSATSLGGGIYLHGELTSCITMTNNIVAANQAATSGPGVYVKGVSALMRHTTIARNTGGDGVGVYVTSGGAVLSNTILVSQTVGIHVDGDSWADLETTLWGAGAWANGSDWDGPGSITTGVVNLWGDPRFANPAVGNYHLRGDSPAIDAGVDAGVATDIDGDPRPRGAAPDIGADESTCLARTGGVDYPTIQQAVRAATLGGTVWVAEGTCYENVAITRSLTLEGGWNTAFSARFTDPAQHTTVDAARAGRAISITKGGSIPVVTVDGFTITGGDASGLAGSGPYGYDIGGGVYGYLATVTLSNCVVRDNVASASTIGWGGGVGFYICNVTLTDNLIEENVASTFSNGYGGGVYMRSGSGTARENTVRDNVASTSSAGWGGGLSFYMGSYTMEDNVVEGNVATAASYTGYGAGVQVYFATLDMEGDIIRDNDAAAGGGFGYGGGVWAGENSTLTMDDVEVSSNNATFGGGVYADDSPDTTLIDVALLSNTAEMGGGFELSGSPGSKLIDSEIAGNTSGYGAGGWLTNSGSSELTGNRIHDNTSAGLAGGVWVNGSDNTALRGNWVYSNAAHDDGSGLFLMLSDDVLLVNNVVAENRITGNGKGAGIRVEGGTASMLHTTLAGNSGGDGSGLCLTFTSTVAMTNTILVSQTVGITVATGSTATYRATLWGAGAWDNGDDVGGSGTLLGSAPNYWAEPGFHDAAYHLGIGSPAIDAGVDAGVTTDIDGGPRPLGEGPDLGADEARFLFLPLVMRNYH